MRNYIADMPRELDPVCLNCAAWCHRALFAELSKAGAVPHSLDRAGEGGRLGGSSSRGDADAVGEVYAFGGHERRDRGRAADRRAVILCGRHHCLSRGAVQGESYTAGADGADPDGESGRE